MNESKKLVEAIINGMQEKKAKNIVVVDLTEINDTITKYLVICEGNTPPQVSAIQDSIREFARKEAGQKPVSTDGVRNCLWVAMDFADVVAHIFVPDARDFYDIENLWEDAPLTEIPDLD